MAIEWTDDLKTGDYVIDGEHKRLLKAADDLIQACNKGKGRDEIGRAVDFLCFYTRTHFAHEEELMEKYVFSGLLEHKKWHEGFTAETNLVADKLKADGPTVARLAEVNGKLSELITHIRTMDLKMAKYIQEKK